MITDASIAAALLWAELNDLASIYGTATPAAQQLKGAWQITAGRWTITANAAAAPVAYTTRAGTARVIPRRAVFAEFDGIPAGIIGPGETCDFAGAPAEATPQRLRRDLHEHVYQYWRSHP